jgi:hypothetical protein
LEGESRTTVEPAAPPVEKPPGSLTIQREQQAIAVQDERTIVA